MESINYRAFRVEETKDGFVQSIQTLSTDQLPNAEVLIQVHYSSINYKDALSASGNKGITKNYPHTPGIDAAGIVVESNTSEFKVGEEVIVTGNDLGMNTSGGLGQYIRVPADWVVKLPKGLSLKESMILGTAGFTAGIMLSRITQQVSVEDGAILVSGATGGVGSVAISLLHKLGYDTVAISGKESEAEFLKFLGASKIISRSDFETPDKRPMLSAKYAGGIDTVGGSILENIIKSLQPLGAVITCGSVSSTQLNLTVFPFILRGISLIGVSSQNYPLALRRNLWKRLADEWKPEALLEMYTEIELDEVSGAIQKILEGKMRGRTIVKMQ